MMEKNANKRSRVTPGIFAKKDSIHKSNEKGIVEFNKSTIYDKPIISGYLYKRGREGKWQRRWFESGGKYLLYFKSKKKKKTLASLDLYHVGSIVMDKTDPSECSFIIAVAERNYHLCADGKDQALDWVISMNRVREARMEIGNLKLIDPDKEQQKVLEDEFTPRVVIFAQRKRAKVLGNEGETSNTICSVTKDSLPQCATESIASSNINEAHLRERPGGVFARWRKGRSPRQNWIRRLSRWTKRLRKLRCVVVDNFEHLDNTSVGRRLRRKECSDDIKHQVQPADVVIPEGEGVTVDNFSTNISADGGVDTSNRLDPETISAGRQSIEGTPTGSEAGSRISNANRKDESYIPLDQRAPINIVPQTQAIRETFEGPPSIENSFKGDIDSFSDQLSAASLTDSSGNSLLSPFPIALLPGRISPSSENSFKGDIDNSSEQQSAANSSGNSFLSPFPEALVHEQIPLSNENSFKGDIASFCEQQSTANSSGNSFLSPFPEVLVHEQIPLSNENSCKGDIDSFCEQQSAANSSGNSILSPFPEALVHGQIPSSSKNNFKGDTDSSSEQQSTASVAKSSGNPFMSPFPEALVPGQILHKNSGVDADLNETQTVQGNDGKYKSVQQKQWGMASAKRALREKMADLALRESDAIGDMHSSTVHDSPMPISEDSGVV